ncbi:MAG TPA: hypothetical protein VMN36_01975 [Verrucomicrobiales bacterium]|nr:hypothetical protein [Verrucomicrobiales bacterium]
MVMAIYLFAGSATFHHGHDKNLIVENPKPPSLTRMHHAQLASQSGDQDPKPSTIATETAASKVRVPLEFLPHYVPYRMDWNGANAFGPIAMLGYISGFAASLGLSTDEERVLTTEYQQFVDEFKELQRTHAKGPFVEEGQTRYAVSVPRTELLAIRNRLESRLTKHFNDEKTAMIRELALKPFATLDPSESFVIEAQLANGRLRVDWKDAATGRLITMKYYGIEDRESPYDEDHLFSLKE